MPPEPRRYTELFLDTEFIDRGPEEPVRLISIALVREDGTSFYAEDESTDLSLAGPWVKKHVIPLLTGPRKSRAQIRSEMLTFVGNWRTGLATAPPRIWGYFGAYDWVLVCGLLGRMVDLPEGFPRFCWDLRQHAETLGVFKSEYPKQPGHEHHALADAQWNRDLFLYLRD